MQAQQGKAIDDSLKQLLRLTTSGAIKVRPGHWADARVAACQSR
jgi:hypothetical protein